MVPQKKTGLSESRRCLEFFRVRKMTQHSTCMFLVQQFHVAQGKFETCARGCLCPSREGKSIAEMMVLWRTDGGGIRVDQ